MSKIHLFFLLSFLIFSCSHGEKSTNSYSNQIRIGYEIDTIKIDAKGEFLFLNYGLAMSDYDPNTDLLYNINPQSSRMEIIDLEKEELKELIQYDQDGPNSVKEMFTSGIKKTDTGELWFTDYRSIIHLNSEGEKIEHLRLNNENFPGDSLRENWEISGLGKITHSGKYYISHYGDYLLHGDGLQGLAIFDLETHQKHLVPIDAFKHLDKYDLSSPDGERAGARSGIWSLITTTDREVLHYNEAENQLYKIDLDTRELTQKILSSDILADEKPGNYPKQATSVEQFEEFKTIKDQELSFGNWIYDDMRDYFWRFSREKTGGTVENPEFTIVITVLDHDLNQIGERKMAVGDAVPFPSLKFFRKGDVYMFLNIEDELAFVRLKPTISYE